jgi:hypothetical protein
LSTFATLWSWDRSRDHAIKFNIRDFKSGFNLGPEQEPVFSIHGRFRPSPSEYRGAHFLDVGQIASSAADFDFRLGSMAILRSTNSDNRMSVMGSLTDIS